MKDGSAMERHITIFLFLACSCSATPQDLSGKAFTLGGATNSYVRLHPTLNGNINMASVCVRFFSDIPDGDRWQTLFSLATPTHTNGLALFKYGRSRYSFYIGNQAIHFWGLPDELNSWNSVCATWDSITGLSQVWVNGRPGSRKFGFKGGSLTGTPIIVLGLDQDSHGGGFDANEALIGQLTDVHMWDHVISPCQINNYSHNKPFPGGNLINWRALTFTTYGNVEEERKINVNVQRDCLLVEKCMETEECGHHF